MDTRLALRSLLVALAASAALPSLAQGTVAPAAPAAKAAAEPMEIRLTRSKIRTADGKEIREAADVAKPGDVLEEVATYSNRSPGTLSKVVATLPVPPNTELVISSLKPANAKASLDGVRFDDMPLKRKVRAASGVEVEEAVPMAEYRFLRWFPGDIPAGKSATFSARFKVAGETTTK